MPVPTTLIYPVRWLVVAVACACIVLPSYAGEVRVDSRAELLSALARAEPGTTIRIGSGVYDGGLHLTALHGEPGSPITVSAADPADPPVLRGGTNGMQLSRVSHVVLEHLVIEGATSNGLNIDDGGEIDEPSHDVVLRGLVVRDVGPRGNRDGIKLSGVVRLRVEDCELTDWGDGGSGVDMVGCHDGVVVGCVFRRTGSGAQGSGVQLKGGTSDVRVLGCRFENAGARAVNAGGSTGRVFFRPALELEGNAEARDLEVAGCVFVGPGTPVAFVGVDGARVHHNTMVGPTPWAVRILQESAAEDFVPCRDGAFTDNLVVFGGEGYNRAVNVGPGTSPESFTFARNWWYNASAPGDSRPRLPVAETGGVYGRDPGLNDAGGVVAGSAASEVGAHAWDGEASGQERATP
ncbi:right-handed parallel beta-helix repeat-containing protein [Phycisphaeraceae bacterium D3-23]